MEKPALTPREFLVLSLLEENRYYKLTDIIDLYNHFIIRYGRSLFYLNRPELFTKIIWQLFSQGYLEKGTTDGEVILLRLSHKGLIEKEPGNLL